MAEKEPTQVSSQCQYVKRNGDVCGRDKQRNKQYCFRCNLLAANKSNAPRYHAPNPLEPSTKAKICANPAIANASELAALPTDSMIPNSEINARLSAIETTLAAIQSTLANLTKDNEEIKESIEDLNNKLDSEKYHRKMGDAICFSKLGIEMPHRMRHESPPSFIVNPIGSLPDSPNHITLNAPKPKGKLTKRQQKMEEKQQKQA